MAPFVGLVSAYTSAHRPHWTYPFTFGLAIIAFVMIGVMLWRPSHWEPEFTNYLVWFTGALQFMAVAFAILSVLAWRRSVAGQD